MQYFLQLSFATQVLLVYLVLINLITFFYFGIDKLKARLSNRRVSEAALWVLSGLGGSLGGFLGMKYFRHKTHKPSFQAVMVFIMLVHVGLIFFFLQ